MKNLKNIIFPLIMLIGAQATMAMQLPKFSTIVESPTLQYLPTQAKQLVLQELASGNVNQGVKNLIVVAQTQKAIRGSLLTVSNIEKILNSLPKTAHVVDVIERLQKMPKTFPMMKDPALMLRLTTAKAELKYGQELHNAVAENDRARVKLLLEHPDIDLNFRRPEYKNQDIVAGCTPLMVYVSDIAYDKYSEYVKSAQNNNGDLYDADVATGRHSCIPKHEPRPVTKDTHDFLTGQKFKHLLAYNFIMPEKEISQLLIEAGANVNTPDKDGWTPLIRAANKHSHAMVESLLKAGAHMKRNGCCSAPLTWAVYSGDLEFVKKFIDAGADVNARNGIDSTALWVASNNCDSRENGDNFHKIIGMLLAAGANPDFKGYNGKTPLIQIITNALECHRPCIEEAKTLLLFGDANPDICDKYGKTACDYVTAEIALLTTKELDDKIRYRLRNCQELKTLLEKASLERKQNIAPGCAIA